MIQLGVIGCGSHSRGYHLPALASLHTLLPELFNFSAVCDLDLTTAEETSQEYGFKRFYTELDHMLELEKLDACIAVTPIPITAEISMQVIRRGIPLLMEKPPGASMEETNQILSLVENTQVPVMVSMNRRFDPALQAALEWKGGRPLGFLGAKMYRHDRTESDFFATTAIHAVDTIRWMAGDVKQFTVVSRWVDNARWYQITFEFESGTFGALEVLPTCGSQVESYEIMGPGYRILANAGVMDKGEVMLWEAGRLVKEGIPAKEKLPYEQNGTYAETVEFLTAIQAGRQPHPSIAEVVQSVHVCYQIQDIGDFNS
jgi:myo-inositol 2-dehydrogenase/D-chiro-inositol 1-dehydrogenase